MAFFSRRKRTDDTSAPQPAAPAEAAEPPRDAEPAEDAEPSDAATEAPDASAESTPAATESAPRVGISVSSFGGLGTPGTPVAPAAAAPRPPAEGPPQTETVPGLRDNVLLREALATLSEEPTPQELIRAGRQVLQNHLFLRVKGDARTLLEEGKSLPLAMVKVGDRQWAVAYSSGAALQRSVQSDGDTATSAMGQPVTAVLQHVLAGDYAGLIIDPASAPARLMLPRDLVERMMKQADPKLALKALLAGPRTESTAGEVAQAMVDAPLFVAVNKAAPGEDGEERMGVAETRDADGTRILELYTHPLEVIAMGRGDQPLPFTPKQLAGALSQHGQLGGVILDAAGPWIRLGRGDLAPVLALAD